VSLIILKFSLILSANGYTISNEVYESI
jgi:hypothetical protein